MNRNWACVYCQFYYFVLFQFPSQLYEAIMLCWQLVPQIPSPEVITYGKSKVKVALNHCKITVFDIFKAADSTVYQDFSIRRLVIVMKTTVCCSHVQVGLMFFTHHLLWPPLKDFFVSLIALCEEWNTWSSEVVIWPPDRTVSGAASFQHNIWSL